MLNRTPISFKNIDFKGNTDSKDSASSNIIHIENRCDVLKQANRVILNQQMAVIEEQRLNVLFQMLGITLHELNQPLTSLLGNIELMQLNQDNPDKLKENIKRVEDAGKRFSSIIRKIQNIRHGKTFVQDHLFCPMKTNKKLRFLALVSDTKLAEKMRSIVEKMADATLLFDERESGALNLDAYECLDLVIVDESYVAASESNIIKVIKNHNNELPVLTVLNPNSENKAFHLLQDGLDGYCPEPELNEQTFARMLGHARENARAAHQLNSALKDLADISIQDEQTGLFQRKFFRDALEREITRAKRKDVSCAICKMDIRDFLHEIDASQKDSRNEILRETSVIIQQTLGESHLVCRYGNESFAFIMSNTSAKEARCICENLQSKLAQYFVATFSLETSPPIYIGSIHFYPEDICPANELMERIDAATSRARETGQKTVFV